jgi:predicted double-glycine peptidase
MPIKQFKYLYNTESQDAEQLAAHLPNVVTCHTVEWPKFNHFDFVTAKDADKLVYDHVVKIMDKFSGNEKLLDS